MLDCGLVGVDVGFLVRVAGSSLGLAVSFGGWESASVWELM